MNILEIINNYTEGRFNAERLGWNPLEERYDNTVVIFDNAASDPDFGGRHYLSGAEEDKIIKLFKKGGDYVKYIRTKIFGYCV